MTSRFVIYRYVILFSGLFLLTLNVAGLLIPLRNPDIYLERHPLFGRNLRLSASQLRQQADSDASDTPKYCVMMTDTVHLGMMHYWKDQGITKYNLRVPPTENYLLYIAGFIYPKYFRKYEFIDYNRAIERGVGMCSQQACVLSELLNKKDVRTKVVGLSGHVVAAALVDPGKGTWWILDPDYGVVVQHDLGAVERNPEIIRPFYAAEGFDRITIDDLVGIYGPSGNIVCNGDRGYYGRRWWVEKLSYFLKWAIPVCLLAVPAGPWLFARNKIRASDQQGACAA